MLEQYRTEFILKTRHSRYGFTLLEGIMALSVLLSLLVLGNYYTQQRLEEEIHQLAAEHLILVSKAATGYAREHYEQIGTEVEKARWQSDQQVELNRDREYTPLSLEAWRYQQMQDYLKKELLAEKNCYQQSYELYISDHLPFGKQLIVLSSEGQAIELKALPVIARKADGSSGYIIQKKAIPTIIGSQHSWKLAVPARTVYNSGENPQDLSVDKIGPGHLARVQIINRVDTLNPENLLHRTPVPGKPELNQMETNLTMQQHQIIFNNESATGILDAEGLQFTQQGEKLLFGWEKQEQQPKIVLRDAKQQEVLITAQNVMATTKNHLPQGTTDYSPPELHAFWNKLPYYEMEKKTEKKDPSTDEFARKICLTSFDDKKSNQPLGRIFMLGRKNNKNENKNYVYICGATIDDDYKTPQAYRIFPKKLSDTINEKKANRTF